MTATAELKPCPFCGSAAVLIEDQIDVNDWIYHVKCPNCEVQTAESYYMGDVMDAWNSRAEVKDD